MQTRIKQVREAADISQQTLAFRTGLSVSTIQKIERGADARFGTVVKIATALGVPLAELLAEGMAS